MTADQILTPSEASLFQAARGSELLIWTVTARPGDYPDKYVARPTSIREKSVLGVVLLADTLDELRAALPYGLNCLARADVDDAVVVEAWL